MQSVILNTLTMKTLDFEGLRVPTPLKKVSQKLLKITCSPFSHFPQKSVENVSNISQKCNQKCTKISQKTRQLALTAPRRSQGRPKGAQGPPKASILEHFGAPGPPQGCPRDPQGHHFGAFWCPGTPQECPRDPQRLHFGVNVPKRSQNDPTINQKPSIS